jgi:hypothetical protein
MKKTLIFTFTNNPGFGDHLRGLVSILQIKKKMGFDLIVNMKGHSFETFFLYETPEFIQPKYLYSYVLNHESNCHLQLCHFINESFKKCDVISIKTNQYPKENEIDDDIKDYIKNLLSIRPEVLSYLENKFLDIPKNYNLFHFRTGDENFNHDVLHESCVSLFASKKKENSVVISDSLSLKTKIKSLYEKEDVYTFLDKPFHTNANANHDTMLDTFADFYLVKNASSVNCYSCYNWISNFIHWTAIVYDVPLFNLKK